MVINVWSSDQNISIPLKYIRVRDANSVCCCSVIKLCLTPRDPINCSTPGFPVLHHLPEFAQTQVHWVSDAIQPSHLLSSPSPPAFNLSQHQGISIELALCIRWPKDWGFSFSIRPSNEYSGFIILRIDWLVNLQSKGLSRVLSSTTLWEHHFFSAQPSLWPNSHIHTRLRLLEKP